MDIQKIARQAASALYGRDYYPDPNEVADAVAVAVLREVRAHTNPRTGQVSGFYIDGLLAAFTPAEPPQPLEDAILADAVRSYADGSMTRLDGSPANQPAEPQTPEPETLQDVADRTLRRIALQYGSTTRRDFRVIEIVLEEMEAKR